MLASRHGKIRLAKPTHGVKPGQKRIVTVRDAIAKLPAIEAGEVHKAVDEHWAASLSDTNLARIRATPEGGDRRDWTQDLKLPCHEDYFGHTDVYGRLSWDKPAPALTTRCISYSNGRYGHPEQDRAISLREAATLQSFPKSFKFIGLQNSKAKQIGNAVPVKLAEAFGKHIIEHFKSTM